MKAEVILNGNVVYSFDMGLNYKDNQCCDQSSNIEYVFAIRKKDQVFNERGEFVRHLDNLHQNT